MPYKDLGIINNEKIFEENGLFYCDNLGLKLEDIVSSINTLKLVPGRFESYKTKNNGVVIIDYAHTPDAFDKILSLVKKIDPNRKIISLFGCGGNRDQHKRPIMAKISEKYSDKIIITDDNPRYESSDKIIIQLINVFVSYVRQIYRTHINITLL